jgi:ribosome-binding ATPase
MKLAIVGAMGSGKSTLFHAFTGSAPAPTTNPKDPALSVVRVRDPRLEWLRDVYQPRKYTPAAVTVCDFPGMPAPDDTTGVKLGELLAAAREADGLIICVRGFEEDTYPYARPAPDPVREVNDVVAELAFADLEIAARRIEKLERKGGNRTVDENREFDALKKVAAALEEGDPVKEAGLSPDELRLMRGFCFLTEKPWVLVLSLPDEGGDAGIVDRVEGPFEARTTLRAKLEAEVADLDEEDRSLFMEELGIEKLAGEAILETAFNGLGTIVFFTTGEDEVRAWPIPGGSKAVEAAGAIHTDLQRGFIRGEVYSWKDLEDAGGDEAGVKKAGKFRLEGKEYIVQDGDVLHVRFSV